MTRTVLLSVRLVLGAAICAGGPAVGSAQTIGASPPVSGFLSVNAGLIRPVTTTFDTVVVEVEGPNREEFTAAYDVTQGPGFDAGGGVLLRDRIMLGLAVSRFADARAGTASISLTHPLVHPTITATAETEKLDRKETGVHVQLGYKLPISGPLELALFGGPSHFTVQQGLIADLDVAETRHPVTRAWSAAISDVETERQTGSAWGYHVGADVGVRLSKTLSLGALARYSRATVSVDDPILSLIRDRSVTRDLDAGGLQVMGGIRLRF